MPTTSTSRFGLLFQSSSLPAFAVDPTLPLALLGRSLESPRIVEGPFHHLRRIRVDQPASKSSIGRISLELERRPDDWIERQPGEAEQAQLHSESLL